MMMTPELKTGTLAGDEVTGSMTFNLCTCARLIGRLSAGRKLSKRRLGKGSDTQHARHTARTAHSTHRLTTGSVKWWEQPTVLF